MFRQAICSARFGRNDFRVAGGLKMVAQPIAQSHSTRIPPWLKRGLYAVFAGVVLLVLGFNIFRPIKVLPRITLAPGLALRDQDGARLTNEDLRGRIVLYNFAYAQCGAACVPMHDPMRAIQTQLSTIDTAGVAVSLVTISFDPARDTPDALRAYAKQIGADAQVWRVATGDAAALKYALGDTFNVYYEAKPDGTFAFDPMYVLVDGWGVIRAYYKTTPPRVDILARDLRLLGEEIKNSTGAARLAYEAAHLFLCYP